jgi:RNA polymerase sigma-70 factor (ECF subfamily)
MRDEPRLDTTTADTPSVAPVRDDDLLARRASGGDRQAFAQLMERYGQPVLSLCYASSLDRHVAEELAQDVFLAAWRGLPRFRGGSSFATWLFAIARNACVDRARRRSSRPRTTPLEAYHQLEAPAAPGGDARRALEAAAELSPPLRQALLLRDVQGLSYEEIAELQGVPVGTVRSRLSAARGAVADRLRGER